MQGKPWGSKSVFCCRGFRLRILYKNLDGIFCIFAVFILAQGFSWKVAMTGVLGDHCSDAIFAFWHEGSPEKLWWKRSSTTSARMRYLHSRSRILLKSREDRDPRRSLLGCIVCILVQGFSLQKLRLHFFGVCSFLSCTMILMNSLHKVMYLRCFYKQLLSFLKGIHSSCNMNHVSIEVIALNFVTSSLFP